MATPSSPTTPAALKAIVSQMLKALCIDKDTGLARSYFSPDIVSEHASAPPVVGREEVLAGWNGALQYMPDVKFEIIDMVAEVDEKEGAGGKVWLFLKATGGMNGQTFDSVDMVTVGKDGLVARMKDCQRITSEN